MVSYFRWLETEAGTPVAERFLTGADLSFAALASNPGLGAEIGASRKSLARLRKWHVHGFQDMAIFYLPLRSGIRIVRIVHGSRDWWGLFGTA